jgi:hypothetical protein
MIIYMLTADRATKDHGILTGYVYRVYNQASNIVTKATQAGAYANLTISKISDAVPKTVENDGGKIPGGTKTLAQLHAMIVEKLEKFVDGAVADVKSIFAAQTDGEFAKLILNGASLGEIFTVSLAQPNVWK